MIMFVPQIKKQIHKSAVSVIDKERLVKDIKIVKFVRDLILNIRFG